MTYTANKKAYSLLESLAYWMAEISYCREKDPGDIGFLDKADKTIHFLFDQLDRAGVPFWAQNSALATSFCPLLTRGTGFTYSAAIAARCTPPPRLAASGR